MSSFNGDLPIHSVTTEKLERLEQDLILHIRTSGVRKQSEISLINEVMEIRRERRQMSSAILENCARIQADNATLQKSTVISEEATQQLIRTHSIDIDRISRDFKEKIYSVQQECAEEYSRNMEKIKIEHKNSIDKLKTKYREKIKLFETKINQLSEAKLNADSVEAQQIASKLVASAKAELDARFNKTVLR